MIKDKNAIGISNVYFFFVILMIKLRIFRSIEVVYNSNAVCFKHLFMIPFLTKKLEIFISLIIFCSEFSQHFAYMSIFIFILNVFLICIDFFLALMGFHTGIQGKKKKHLWHLLWLGLLNCLHVSQ